jgi:hypothetical protein
MSKGPTVRFITPTVQLVTTRNHARTEQWTEHWVEEANAQLIAEIRSQDNQRTATGKQTLPKTTGPYCSGTEPDISDLAGIQVTMTLEHLLRLVPSFEKESAVP